MKYISFAIPCYNSQDYMAHAIESILPGGEDVEIIIVNDGSKDRTSEIAHDYMEKYPTIVKVVDKENGGHGDAVNSGLTHATGKYFKVVDSDDWVDEDALHKILEVLRHMEEDAMELDMLIANYVYEKVGAAHKKVIHYRNVLPQDEIFRWMIWTFSSGSVYSDAFSYLSHRYVEINPASSAEAYILCGQYLCILSTSTCAKDLLYGCRFLQIFYRTRGSVG